MQKHTVEQHHTILAVATESAYQQEVAQRLQIALASDTHVVEILEQTEAFARDLEGKMFLSLLELQSSFFETICEENWSSFKAALTKTRGILWATQGYAMSSLQSSLALITGLGRAIRSENLDINFIELSLEHGILEQQVVSQIINLYRKSLLSHRKLEDSEFMQQDSQLCIARVAESTSVNLKIHNAATQRYPELAPFQSVMDRNLKLTVEEPGLLDTLCFDDDMLRDQPLESTEVEIQVKASGLNFKDVLIALGQIAGNVLGFECSGLVTQAGPESGYQTGDKVCACTTTGGFKTFVRTDSTAVMKMPENMSFTVAAGIPMVFATAFYSLVVVANLREGESVLIHSGSGGVGQAAIQIAQRLKARIFTTVGFEAKRKLLTRLYGITEDHVFSSRDTFFAKRIMAMTGLGVDVVLNSLSGEGQTVSWSCLAPLGRFVELGKADIETPRKGLPMAPFAKNVSFHSVSLDIVMNKAKPLMRRIISGVSKLLTDGSSITVPQPAARLLAFRY